MKLNIELDIEIVDKFIDNKDTIARVFYPNEGGVIKIVKGLNTITLSEAIFHEIGHIVDWYISNETQSSEVEVREKNADVIGGSLRFKVNSD